MITNTPAAKASEHPGSDLVRRRFLEFFAARGHEQVPSAPLLPQNDPTLMFTTAATVPFKYAFTGKDTRPTQPATPRHHANRIRATLGLPDIALVDLRPEPPSPK